MTSRIVRVCFFVWIASLTALYYAFPDSHLYTWAAIGYSSAAMILVGIRLHQPARKLPWYLLALALLFFDTGDNLYNLIIAAGHEPTLPGPAAAKAAGVPAVARPAFLRRRRHPQHPDHRGRPRADLSGPGRRALPGG